MMDDPGKDYNLAASFGISIKRLVRFEGRHCALIVRRRYIVAVNIEPRAELISSADQRSSENRRKLGR